MTREHISHHLQTVDLERAIGLIERIKTLHDNNRWEASTEHYQTLRAMLSDVIARCPEDQSAVRENLAICENNRLWHGKFRSPARWTGYSRARPFSVESKSERYPK